MPIRIAIALLPLAAGCGGCKEESTNIDAAISDTMTGDTSLDAALDGAATGPQIHYLKASNTEFEDIFGGAVAISGDGSTIAISAPMEGSGATGINGDQSSNTLGNAGAVYIFVRSGETWTQEAYVKASNAGSNYSFGDAVALSHDGNTLVVGSHGEHSGSTGINQSQADDNLGNAGAAYVFVRTNGVWAQQAYVKPSTIDANDMFGLALALSADGNTLAVSAQWESSSAVGVNGDQLNNDANLSGAVYVFTRTGTQWSQQTYLKASNTDSGDYFGVGLALTDDGNTMAIGARGEASGIPGNESDNSTSFAGAVYVFRRSGDSWSQQAYLKAPYPGEDDGFGTYVSISADGATLAVAAEAEDSAARGIDQNAQDESAMNSGAVYVFEWTGSTWSAPLYIKASNSDAGDFFGSAVALNAAGDQLMVCARGEASASTGYAGDPADNSASEAGAAYLFERTSGGWTETKYLKASNAEAYDRFGTRGGMAADGATLVISAPAERSSATGVDGNQMLNNTDGAGAAYVFAPFVAAP